jgi:hypothetical protein
LGSNFYYVNAKFAFGLTAPQAMAICACMSTSRTGTAAEKKEKKKKENGAHRD